MANTEAIRGANLQRLTQGPLVFALFLIEAVALSAQAPPARQTAATLKLETGKQIYDAGLRLVPRAGRQRTVAEPRGL